ncbi:hypothetical protein U1Q18_033784 [Sarracenia purpurea var. burkii]
MREGVLTNPGLATSEIRASNSTGTKRSLLSPTRVFFNRCVRKRRCTDFQRHWIRRRCVGDTMMRSLEQGFRRSSRSIQRIQETTMRFVGVQGRFRFCARQQHSRVQRKNGGAEMSLRRRSGQSG